VGPSRSKLDSLSYVGIMPLEQVVIDVNSDYAERHLSGTGRLVALQDSMLLKLDSHLVSGSFGLPAEPLADRSVERRRRARARWEHRRAPRRC